MYVIQCTNVLYCIIYTVSLLLLLFSVKWKGKKLIVQHWIAYLTPVNGGRPRRKKLDNDEFQAEFEKSKIFQGYLLENSKNLLKILTVFSRKIGAFFNFQQSRKIKRIRKNYKQYLKTPKIYNIFTFLKIEKFSEFSKK